MFRSRHNYALLLDTPRFTITDGNDGPAGGGDDNKPDRGDDYTPPGDDDDAAAKEAAEKAAAEAKEKEGKTSDELSEEEEETEEERAEREAEEARAAEEAAKAARKRIPLNRHEEILNKQREQAAAKEAALARRIEELEKNLDKTPKVDPTVEMRKQINELQDKYEELLFDGKKDEAKKVRSELDELREKYTDTKTSMTSAAARDAAIETLKYEQALAKVESEYPALNPDGDSFEEAKANEVAELLTLFQKNGLTRQAALTKAVKYVMGPPASKKDTDTAAEALRQRKAEEARRKAAEAAAKQPPAADKVGADNDTKGGKADIPSVMKMDQDTFAKLDEAALAKLRGDVL